MTWTSKIAVVFLRLFQVPDKKLVIQVIKSLINPWQIFKRLNVLLTNKLNEEYRVKNLTERYLKVGLPDVIQFTFQLKRERSNYFRC